MAGAPLAELPCITPELEGTGGRVRASPEDFEVEEIPAYAPSGEGPHLFLWVEKRERNTRDVARELARALQVAERDVGVAGQKDRLALTRQRFSVPGRSPEEAKALEGPGWRVLEAARHQNKLRTGHLKGNRFRIRIRGVGPQALERARRVARALEERGFPNAFGPQRFGRDGLNALRGRALVRGEPGPRSDRFLRRLSISAYQALLFNRVLAERIRDGLFATAVEGDLMKKLDTGGLFVSRDAPLDGPRVARFELSATGPMFGHRMMEPEAEALARERRVLEAEGLSLASFAPLKADAEGTRRALRLPIQIAVEAEPDALCLRFALDKGCFATCVLREVMKEETPPLEEDRD
jgi:tRNA pseudouridine13 synthase